ncbi:MAG: hypothetical protein ABID87_02890 [Chloroflexota bacterium]
MVLREKSCPQCRGDLWLDLDEYGWYEQCIMCGYLCSLEGLSYICGAEQAVVTEKCNPKLYPFRAVIETLKQAMRHKVEEAREYIVNELSQGALERRQLQLRIIGRGILRYTFDKALQELRDSGVVAVVTLGKSKRKKLVLAGDHLAFGPR